MSKPALNRPDLANSQSFPQALSKKDDCVRVVSYNIRIDHDLDRNGPNDWEKRKNKIVTLLRAYKTQIMGLQESDQKQLNYLIHALPEYRFIDYLPRLRTNESEHLPIGYLPDLFTCLDHGCFWLSETPATPSLGWDGRYSRICSWVKLNSRKTDKNLWVFNTHFDHKGVIARLQSASLITQKIAQLTGTDPVVFMGDLNLFPEIEGQKVYDQLLQGNKPMQDVRDLANAHYGPDGTWIGWEYDSFPAPEGKIGNRLDHMFVGGPCQVLREGVLNVTTDAQGQLIPSTNRNYPSDHLPIVVDLQL